MSGKREWKQVSFLAVLKYIHQNRLTFYYVDCVKNIKAFGMRLPASFSCCLNGVVTVAVLSPSIIVNYSLFSETLICIYEIHVAIINDGTKRAIKLY